jgi:hypothetical protein
MGRRRHSGESGRRLREEEEDNNDSAGDGDGRRWRKRRSTMGETVFGRYVFWQHRKFGPGLVWIYLQLIGLTVWMVICMAMIYASRWGWLDTLGIPVLTEGSVAQWTVVATGAAFVVISTHMGWAEKYQAWG